MSGDRRISTAATQTSGRSDLTNGLPSRDDLSPVMRKLRAPAMTRARLVCVRIII
jgi:hypothetical protein